MTESQLPLEYRISKDALMLADALVDAGIATEDQGSAFKESLATRIQEDFEEYQRRAWEYVKQREALPWWRRGRRTKHP